VEQPLLEPRQLAGIPRFDQLSLDVLIVDELGFVPFDRIGGELLSNLITDRDRRSITAPQVAHFPSGALV
jgi:hypothetical protein